jgi:hypothetical protein
VHGNIAASEIASAHVQLGRGRRWGKGETQQGCDGSGSPMSVGTPSGHTKLSPVRFAAMYCLASQARCLARDSSWSCSERASSGLVTGTNLGIPPLPLIAELAARFTRRAEVKSSVGPERRETYNV